MLHLLLLGIISYILSILIICLYIRDRQEYLPVYVKISMMALAPVLIVGALMYNFFTRKEK
jgi:hypothetical protein